MSDPYPSKEVLPSQSFSDPQPEKPLIEDAGKAGKALITDTTPRIETSPASPLAVMETDEPVVESRIQKVCKTMCVTTASSLLVIAWASAFMLFSGFASYRIMSTMPFFHGSDFLVWFYYPATAVLVVVYLLSPVYAVVGDALCRNFRMLVAGVTSFHIAGIVVAVVGAIIFAMNLSSSVPLGAAFVFVLYLLIFLAVGIFQTNAIQFGRAALRDSKSPELSAFVHWYYWALYLPTFLSGAAPLFYLLFSDEEGLVISALTLSSIIMFAVLVLFVVTFTIHCTCCITGRIVTEQRIAKNPVTLVCRVTQYALQHPASAGHRGFFTRLNNTRRSKGGPADDEEVDSVAKFWLLALLMVSLFGFFFWDDMWAVSLVNALVEGTISLEYGTSDHYFTSSQLTTSAVIVICIPVYQLILRPFMGKHSFPLLWRIWIGLILELISLALVTWSSAVTESRIGPEALSNFRGYVCGDQKLVIPNAQNFDWEILLIPQVINGLSQLLVFPAVIELILTDAPRVMHGLLIGLWYTLQSIHFIVGIFETATCAGLYWHYYLMKIAFVLISIGSFGATAVYYKRKQALFSYRLTSMEDQTEVVVCSDEGAV